jgi:hypothetical protein
MTYFSGMFRNYSCYLFVLLFFIQCKKNTIKVGTKTHFTLISNTESQINFKNVVEENLDFNFLNFTYIYNGAGVAVGDINNDGLEDIYFSSNQNSNKLYLNLGDFKFNDITNTAKVKDDKGWTTGVCMIDINNDGWLDIYVCKSGSLKDETLRQNKLFINQKDNTFKEQAEKYGLNDSGFSTQSYFLDFDKDGDLDMYLVNHRVDFHNNRAVNPNIQKQIEPYSSDQFYRNDNGKFTNITNQAGIANKAWGLSASIGDFNNDNWPDIFVANDFLEPDFLYINNKNGTFTDQSLKYFKHTSFNSMGSDFADINNDLLPDLVVLDMLAEDRIRGKENMASMSTETFNSLVDAGYNYQYMSNMLQLNNDNKPFNEIGQLAGIAKTDWSWSPLIADFDNDGFNDLFITNGIEHDLTNQDFRNQIKQNLKTHKKVTLEQAIDMMPSTKLSNYMFLNNKDYTFKNVTKSFGLDKKINSNGVAYADLDNDGDLDLVINNQSEIASIYQNNATNNYLKISLNGNPKNKNGVGASVIVYSKNNNQLKINYSNRGYLSSVSNEVIFGLKNSLVIDSLKVIWNDQKTQVLYNIETNKHLKISYANAEKKSFPKENNSIFEEIKPSEIGITYKHYSVLFDDYKIQVLLPQKQSTIDNALAIADVNNDGLEDIFIGNTQGHSAELYIQNASGNFSLTNTKVFENDKSYNDNNALFFDADNDNDLDLYVATGNYSLVKTSRFLQDRLYINDGKGNFSRSNNLPKMLTITKAIAVNDFDQDGDLDIFVGGRVVPQKYPIAPESYLLENRNGKFFDVTKNKSKDIKNIGLVTDAIFSDYDQDGDKDLFVVGEWMNVTIFNNNNGNFKMQELQSNKIKGWFQTIKPIDFDQDGDDDYFIGNFGKNNKFHPTIKKPLHLYATNFDQNSSYDIALSKESNGELFPLRGKECSSEQTPFLNKKISNYKKFANSNIYEIYGKEFIDNALHLKTTNFESYYIKNNGKGNLEFISLPNNAQFGPILNFESLDINKDGNQEILGVGFINPEVETIKYDGSSGFILDTDLTVINNNLTPLNTKNCKKINIKNQPHLIFLNANNQLSILKLN